MVNDLSSEKLIHLYKCILEISKIMEFNSFNKAFYCGTRLKWKTPNALLIVIDDDCENRFYKEMGCELGCTGSGYLDAQTELGGHHWDASNKHNTFHYKVIFQTVYDALYNNWYKLADESWIYPNNMKYIPGIDITDSAKKYYNMTAFL